MSLIPIEIVDHEQGLRFVRSGITSCGAPYTQHENALLVAEVIATKMHRSMIREVNIQKFT